MKSLDKILRMADTELDSIAANGKFRSREEVESVEKLIKTAKEIYCIWEMEEGEDESYSAGPRRIYRDGRDEYSARGRRNARRDSMGRYRDGYADHGYADKLRELMDTAPDEQTRNTIRRMMESMDNA